MAHSEQVVEDCYHEAAHAVFFHDAGVEIRGLWVGGQGTIDHEWPNSPPSGRALALAAGCLAGPLSAQRLRGEEFLPMAFDEFVAAADAASSFSEEMAGFGFAVDPEALRAVWPEQVGDDYEDALAMLETAQPECGELEECYREALSEVRRGLEERWEEIEAVAVALMGDGRLDGPATVRVIEEARKRKTDDVR